MLKSLSQRLRQSLLRYARAERGVAAIEFAFVGPPFMLIFFVTIESGLMMLTEYSLQSAVQDSSRLVRTGQAQLNPLSKAQFKTEICKTAKLIIDCSGLVTVYVRSDANFQTLKNNLPPLLNIGPSVGGSTSASGCYNPGQPAQPAAVVATYDWNFNVWGMSAFGNMGNSTTRRLVGFTIFMNEPFPTAPALACA